jgi:hypothetical protein
MGRWFTVKILSLGMHACMETHHAACTRTILCSNRWIEQSGQEGYGVVHVRLRMKTMFILVIKIKISC